MELTKKDLKKLIVGMRQAYLEGKNVMSFARNILKKYSASDNQRIAILIAYDLQAGTYIEAVRKNYDFYKSWCRQLVSLMKNLIPKQGSILEVGVGEATTLSGVLELLGKKVSLAFGFDISLSRLILANEYLKRNIQKVKLFVADLQNIPLPDNSVDVVYSSHSFEPNRGYEEIMILECMRVARKAVVIVEPIYELASSEAKLRMDSHGYVKGLYKTAKRLNLEVLDYRLLKFSSNILNPSGVLSLKKKYDKLNSKLNSKIVLRQKAFYICPITGHRLAPDKQNFLRSNMGTLYPVLSGVPLLRKEHAIISSKYS
jgi:ubiquinone/menaquinone biosynthesis C-methylase UbiE